MEKKKESHALIPTERIERRILFVRGQKVMLDSDLAELYDVPTKALNQAVRRNRARFPADFMFELTRAEYRLLRSQLVTLEPGRGRYSKYLPYAFTEQGIAMLSSVLRSDRAVLVNVAIMRTFVRLRQLIASNSALARRLEEMELWVKKQKPRLATVYQVVGNLISTMVEESNKEPIGFTPTKKKKK